MSSFSSVFSISLLSCCLLSPYPALAKNERNALPVNELQRFTTVLETIHNAYVDPVSDQTLFDNAISGMLSELDPHSSYLDPAQYQALQSISTGHFGGLGMEVTGEAGLVRIVSAMDDSPAQKADLRSGDLIVRINEMPVKGVALNKVVEWMRGDAGSKVTLTIFRKSSDRAFSVTLKREIIKVMSVKSKALEPGYMYMRIAQFQNQTGKEVVQALEKAMREAPQGALSGLILDLRNNPGGVLEASVQTANAFLDAKHTEYKGLIVYTKGRLDQMNRSEKAHGKDLLQGAPLIVLINEGSASAAEIVAGALQDQHRALIVGERSFGKGSVQSVLPLQNGYGLKITTALYYTPSGRSIQANGIEPDVVVAQYADKKSAADTADPKHKKDGAEPVIQNPVDLWSVRESDLPGHIEQAEDSSAKAQAKNKQEQAHHFKAVLSNPALLKPVQAQPETEEWIAKDAQLLQAIELLKALTLYKASA